MACCCCFFSSSPPTLGFNLRGKFLAVAGGLQGNLSADAPSPTQKRGLAWGRNFSDLSPASAAASGKTEDAQSEIRSIWRHRHLHHSYRTDAGREIKRITVPPLKSLSDNFSSIYLDVSGNTPTPPPAPPPHLLKQQIVFCFVFFLLKTSKLIKKKKKNRKGDPWRDRQISRNR